MELGVMHGSQDRPLLKVGGAMAVCGAVAAIAGNLMHPRSTDYYGDPVLWLNHNTQSGIWFSSHVLILLGVIALVGAYVALSSTLAGTRGHGMASLALANAQIGTALVIVTLAIDGLVVPKLAGVWRTDSAPSPDAVLAGGILYHTVFSLLYVFMITLFGLTPIFYGIALLLAGSRPRWFSVVGILIGSCVVATGLLSMFGVATEFLDAVVWTGLSSLFVLWLLGIGVMLWRRAEPTRVIS